MTIWKRIQLTKLSLQLLFNPMRTELIFKGVELVSAEPDLKPIKAVEDAAMSDANFRAMYESRYSPPMPKLDELAKCPEGSFGLAVYDHMHSRGLTFDLFPQVEAHRPVQYLSSRIYQDHDLWHVLFGYGVEVEDELAIQAFAVAQFKSPIAVMLVAGGLIHLLFKDAARAIIAFGKVNEGYLLGRRMPFLLGVKLQEMFDLPLNDVRVLVDF